MTNTPPLIIAVDGGGTGCRAAVGTGAGGVLAEAKGGPANVSTNFDQSVANIMQAVLEALGNADLGEVDLSHSVAHLGLAGADLESIQTRTATMFPFGQTHVSGDRQTNVAGVLGDQDGYVVALGTGTIIARQQAGAVRTVGGWGFQLSDQASGAWLGRCLLTYTLNAEEGLEESSDLTRAVAADLDGVQGIFDWSNGARPADYAGYAPQLFAAGKAADKVAVKVLSDGAAYIARGLDTLGFANGDVLSLAGGVGPHYAPYLPDRYLANLAEPKGNALQGAFSLARAAASKML